ncbi:MAG: hypothetical protein FJY95_04820 [Candidatus Handelsmanbacteria bacterium]|nr:hypothetical protein [Candidatus Handelsmanbacteria bacterium]
MASTWRICATKAPSLQGPFGPRRAGCPAIGGKGRAAKRRWAYTAERLIPHTWQPRCSPYILPRESEQAVLMAPISQPKKAATGLSLDLVVQQFIGHGQLDDLGLQVLGLLLPKVGRTLL